MLEASRKLCSQAARVAWESTMDGVSVASAFALRYGPFLGNHYADPDRLCAQLEETRRRRRAAQSAAGETVTDEPGGHLEPGDVFVIDARRADEYNHSHIYSAVNCHYSDVESVGELCAHRGVPKEQSIVVYCAVGLRSGWMAKKLRKMGYSKASVLYRGYYHWVNTGHPIYTTDGERAHEVLPQHLAAALLLPAHIKAAAVEVKEKSKDATHGVKEKSREAAEDVREGARELVKEKSSELRDAMSQAVHH